MEAPKRRRRDEKESNSAAEAEPPKKDNRGKVERGEGECYCPMSSLQCVSSEFRERLRE